MTLPGLDTSEITLMAYWNAIDNGAVEVDPYETESAMDSYTEYENGVEGLITSGDGRRINVRVKDDGWFVAWLDDTEDFGLQKQDPDEIRGRWDIITDWTVDDPASGNFNFTENYLFRAVQSLQSQLSSGPNFNWGDVGLYDYEHGYANLTYFKSKTSGWGTEHDITWVAGTDVSYWASIGNIHDNYGGSATHAQNTASIALSSGDGGLGAYDALNNGTVSDGQTVSDGTSSGSKYAASIVMTLVGWT